MCFETGAGNHKTAPDEQSLLTIRVGRDEKSAASIGVYHVYMDENTNDYLGEAWEYDDQVKANKCHQEFVDKAVTVSGLYEFLAIDHYQDHSSYEAQ